jgi:hypothetical protein
VSEPYPEALLESLREAIEKVAPDSATVATIESEVFGTETMPLNTSAQ